MLNADIPETLEEAQKLIVTDRNHATDSLLAAVAAETLNSRIIASQLAIGADVSACDSVRHENMMQTLRRRLVERVVNVFLGEGDGAKRVEKIFDEYFDTARILSYYADLPQMFFTLARRRDDAAIESLLTRYGADAINTTDVKGETALDFAISHDPSAASVLRQHGAKQGVYQIGSERMREMLQMGSKGFTDEIRAYFIAAIDSKCLDLNAFVDFGNEQLSGTSRMSDYDPVDGQTFSAETTCVRRKTNVFLEAILNDDTGRVVKKCIDAGVDVNMKIEFVRDKMFMWTDERGFIEYEGVKTGEFVMESPLDLAILAKNPMVVELLTKAGAKNYAQLRKERLLSE